MGIRTGVDVGGTFTDLVAADTETGSLTVTKVSSVPSSPDRGVVNAVTTSGIDVAQIDRFAHGTTTSTNAAIEREGATVGLLTTAGFEDVVEIQRIDRAHKYDLQWDKPRHLVPRHLRLGVAERVDAHGRVAVPLDEAGVVTQIELLRERGAEVIAVCLLFSFLNPGHERRVRELIREWWPAVPVSISSDVMNQVREYERTSTVVLDAYVKPKVSAYVRQLEGALSGLGMSAELTVMSSAGGALAVEDCTERPVNTLMSGPAAGVVAARHFGLKSGAPNLITVDMGGTSSDVALIQDGDPTLTTGYEIEWGIPVGVPMIDIRTVGAGGGSLARLDEGGRLKVGPHSAGADPGPACYGRGNTHPTVTDANLVLGLLNAEYFAGGAVALDPDAATAAIRTHIAEPLGLSVEDAANGIVDVANNNMANLIRIVTVQQGHDPRDFSLLAFGGGGPVHATALARALSIEQVVIPPSPGVLSAVGLLLAPPRYDFVQSYFTPLDRLDMTELQQRLEELEGRGHELLARTSHEGATHASHSLEMRYARQNYQIGVALDPEAAQLGDLESIRTAFTSEYRRLFGYSMEDQPVEIVALHVTVAGDTPELELSALTGTSMDAARKASRLVYQKELRRRMEWSVFERELLPCGESLPSPCIVEQMDSTTIVGPDDHAFIDDAGSLIVEIDAAKRGSSGRRAASERSDAAPRQQADAEAPVRLSDFFEGYPKCATCGKPLGANDWIMADDATDRLYCDAECLEFARSYAERRKAVEARAASAPR